MDDPLMSHQLALMFMVLAIGSLMDITRPAYNIEAEKYHQLARAALFQSPIFEEPTLAAVQTLVSIRLSGTRAVHMPTVYDMTVSDGLLPLSERASWQWRRIEVGIHGSCRQTWR